MAEHPTPDVDAPWWTTSDVAAYLGVSVGTVSSYRGRNQLPEPDELVGRTWVWKPARIVEWDRNRPRKRARGEMAERPQPDPDAEWWTTTDVAAYLGVSLGTVSAYRARRQLPEPDGRIGQSWIWAPVRITTWHKARPRKRARREKGTVADNE